MMTRNNEPQIKNGNTDTAIKFISVKIQRDQLPAILKKHGITADKLICYQHTGTPDMIRIGYTTGELPKGEVQFRVPMDDKPGMMIWDKVNDGLVFTTIFNRGEFMGRDFKDDAKWLGYLTRTNGQPAKFVDTVVPLKDMMQIAQYAYVNGQSVWLNSPDKPGLTMVRVDRNNRRITALATDKYGKATKLVALDVEAVKNDPTLLERPEAWQTLVETKQYMTFYSRAELEGDDTIMIVHFQENVCRPLKINERKHTVEWEGLQGQVSYYVVGILPDHNHVVGYNAQPNSNDVELRFAPRKDQAIHTGFNIPS